MNLMIKGPEAQEQRPARVSFYLQTPIDIEHLKETVERKVNHETLWLQVLTLFKCPPYLKEQSTQLFSIF